MTVRCGHSAAHRAVFSSYTAFDTMALFGRATMPKRSASPNGAHTTKRPSSYRTPTLEAVVGQVLMAPSVDV